jgi:tetratricopeptide (TPR) repeat protein
MRRAAATTLLVCLLGAAAASAESLQSIWRTANDAAARGDGHAAIAQYERLVSAGVDDPDVYYNLGLAHAHRGELGAAIAAFERAARLAPNDDDTTTALTATRAALGKRRAEHAGEATVETRPPLLEGLVQPYRQDAWAVGLLTLSLLAFTLLGVRQRLRAETWRMACAMAAVSCMLAASAAGAALLVKRGSFDDGEAAIVLHEGAALRDGPDPRATARATAHEGARARVLARDGGFVRVRVASGPDGWMRATDVAVIERRLTR